MFENWALLDVDFEHGRIVRSCGRFGALVPDPIELSPDRGAILVGSRVGVVQIVGSGEDT
jgi:hypothetical protein